MQTWPEFRSAYFFDVLRRHFRYRSIVPPLPFLDTSRPILGVHLPHSIFPMTMLLTPALFGLPSSGKTSYAAQVTYPMHHLPDCHVQCFAAQTQELQTDCRCIHV